MRRVLLLAAMLILAGCQRPGPTAHEAATTSASAAPDDAHKLEAQALSAHPGFARRDGDALVISTDGKDRARLTGGWTFRGVEHLQSASGIDTYALVARDMPGGATAYAFVGADPDVTLFDAWPSVSPGGQYIVAANAGGSMTLTDWGTPYPHTVYDFSPDCTFTGWTSDREGQARCTYPEGKATLADIALYNQVWRLSDAEEIDPAAPSAMPVADSHLKKRATLISGAPGQATDAGKLKALGFERLN